MAPKAHVLMIEDNIDTLRAYERIFELEGYRVSHAVTGAIGLEIVSSLPIDLVLVDLRLPDMDGIEIVQQIRRVNTEIPIIISSAYNPAPLQAQCRDLNVSAFLLKPTSYEELFALVEQVVPRSNSAVSAK